MSGGLYPTKTRMALLAAADLGNVVRSASGEDYRLIPDCPCLPQKVTAAVAEMAADAVGWLRLGDGEPRTWRLTERGAEVLREHEERMAPGAGRLEPAS